MKRSLLIEQNSWDPMMCPVKCTSVAIMHPFFAFHVNLYNNMPMDWRKKHGTVETTQAINTCTYSECVTATVVNHQTVHHAASLRDFEDRVCLMLILKISIVMILTTLIGGAIIPVSLLHKFDYYRSGMYPVRIPARPTLPDYAPTQQAATKTKTMARPTTGSVRQSPAAQNETHRTANPPTSGGMDILKAMSLGLLLVLPMLVALPVVAVADSMADEDRVVLRMVVDEENTPFVADCEISLSVLEQRAHSHCAVHNVENLHSCRMQLTAAVIGRCRMKYVTAATPPSLPHGGCSMMHDPLRVAIGASVFPQTAPSKNENDAMTAWMEFLHSCSQANRSRESSFSKPIQLCQCRIAMVPNSCKCSKSRTVIPSAELSLFGQNPQGAWPHAMVIWHHGLVHLDEIVSELRAQPGFSIIRIEVVDYAEDGLSSVIRSLYGKEMQTHPNHIAAKTKFLQASPPTCVVILFLDHDPVLATYGEGTTFQIFSNKGGVDLKWKLRKVFNPRRHDGTLSHDHIVHVTDMPPEFAPFLSNFPGERPTQLSGYYSSHYAFFSPYFFRSRLTHKTGYWVKIVDIDKLRIGCAATAGNCVFGDTVSVQSSPHFCFAKLGDACDVYQEYYWKGLMKKRLVEDHTPSSFLNLRARFHSDNRYPMCVHTTSGARLRSYVIVSKDLRILDGAHRVSLAASLGATRIEVIVLGSGRSGKSSSGSGLISNPLPCFQKAPSEKADEYDASTPAMKLSLGLRTLAACHISFVIIKVSDPATFPTSQKIGGDVDILLGGDSGDPQEAVTCLLSIFPAAETSPVTSSHVHVDIKRGAEIFLRFDIYAELPFAGAHPLWKADIHAHAEAHLSTFGVKWKIPSAKDNAAIRYFEWRDWHQQRPEKLKHLQWIADHPTIMFPLPDVTSPLATVNASYRSTIDQPQSRVKQSCKWRSAYSQREQHYIPLNIVVFSKDRPSQLLLLLRSMERHVVDWQQIPAITVIVSSSNEEFVQGYILVQRKYPCIKFAWDMREGLFRRHVLDTLTSSSLQEKHAHTLMLVDDNVFVRPMALRDVVSAFSSMPKSKSGGLHSVSIRMHSKISHTYTTQLPSPPPSHLQRFDLARWQIDRHMFVWNSCDAELSGDWAYSVSIASDVYNTKKLQETLIALSFSTPNQMESQMFVAEERSRKKMYSSSLPTRCERLIASIGLSPCVVSMPFNRVQTDFPRNIFDSVQGLTTKALNDEFLKNGKILALPDVRLLDFTSTNSVPNAKLAWDAFPLHCGQPNHIDTLIITASDPAATFLILAEFLGAAAEQKSVGYELALRYNGSLQHAIADLCRWRFPQSSEADCFRQIATALDGYSPIFPCMRHGWSWAGDEETALFHSNFCLGAEATVVRHLKALGLWGWAGSICENHRQDGSLAQFVAGLTSEDAITQLNLNLNRMLRNAETRGQAVHMLRVRVALLIYAKTNSASLPKDEIRVIQDVTSHLARFEYTYTGSQVVAAAFVCLSFGDDVNKLRSMQKGKSKPRSKPSPFFSWPWPFFSEILKWCSALASKFVSGHQNNQTTTNPLLEGADSIFAAQTLLPHGRAIAKQLNSPAVKMKGPIANVGRLIIGVMSKPEHVRRRSLIRRTWGSICRRDSKYRDNGKEPYCDLVFVLGAIKFNSTLRQTVQTEYQTYGDVLWVRSIQEGFGQHLTRKIGAFFSFALHLQPPHRPRMVFRTDDDVYVRVHEIMEEGKTHPVPMFWGHSNTFEKVNRVGKYKLDTQTFGSYWFPAFMSGGRHVLSLDLLKILLVHRPLTLSTSSLDDVYIAMQLSNIVEGINDPRFYDGDCLQLLRQGRGSQGGGTPAIGALVCESSPGKLKNDNTLEAEFGELFRRGL
jgi:hypothetical protein